MANGEKWKQWGNELSKDLKVFGSETLLKRKNVRVAKWVSELT